MRPQTLYTHTMLS